MRRSARDGAASNAWHADCIARGAMRYPGVSLVEGTTRAPSSAFHAVKVALCTPGVRVDATAAPTQFQRTVPGWPQSVGATQG